jgi:Pentapeptide repeats (8 copies)
MTKIINRFTGNIIIEDKNLSLRELLMKAIEQNSDLRGSDLRGSDLRDSNLSGSDLSGSNLSGSDLRGSNLSGSDLSGSDLSGSDLRYSNLRGSDLRDSNLSDSDLRHSDLSGSNLSGSKLRGVKNIEETIWLSQAKQNILFIFRYVPISEIEGLKQKIIEGKIDGSQYKGDCCCLIRSLGDDRISNCIPYYSKGLHNLGEQLFYQIKKGDTPETNQFSKIALDLCNEYLTWTRTTKII